ncbi:D-amino acid dehydrogenase, small subunit, protein [Herbaspirillum rubrisubalbicans M1]|uniref:FAD-dependent oxidoreductase n=1 Tax=Herbaspirillum rubrisubalbicans TaxID=80842 RepID=UPI00073A2623|nr:FAD-dependent oxidoreductase [Herbaspirillum rubrisubalbicans]ALU89309.1 D-amino acid dehydrogenase, small subunit, protein [Herbaspirillum rubrisubalbicans M1]
MNSTHRQIAVIGGGLSGICSAYFLAAKGYEVAVIERRAHVAEEATFGDTGLLAPGVATPLTLPGAMATFACRFQDEPRVLLASGTDFGRRRWMGRTRQAQQYFAQNKLRLSRLSAYGQALTLQLQTHYNLEHENGNGVFHLFRLPAEAARMGQMQEAAEQCEFKHQALDTEAIRALEPAFSSGAALAGALYYPDDIAGNCVLFAKQMRNAAQELGVRFHFDSTVTAIQAEFGGRVMLQLQSPHLASQMRVDAVVVTAGMSSAELLRPLDTDLPLRALQSYSALVPVKNPDDAPSMALYDDSYKVAMTRLGGRIRISGLLGFVQPSQTLPPKALRNLLKIAGDYYPNAANYNQAHFWSNTMALLPHGLPLIGPTRQGNVFVNVGHGATGWAASVGSARLLADLVAGEETEIPTEGLLPRDVLA